MNAKRSDKIATGVLYAVAGIIVLILASLLLYILVRGLPHISWEFLTSPSKGYQEGGGIGIQLFNSIYLLFVTMVISFPISMGAGIYLSEYAKKNWVTDVIRTSIEILSSLPSVVVGLFGFLILSSNLAMAFDHFWCVGTYVLQFASSDEKCRRIYKPSTIHNVKQGLSLGLSGKQ